MAKQGTTKAGAQKIAKKKSPGLAYGLVCVRMVKCVVRAKFEALNLAELLHSCVDCGRHVSVRRIALAVVRSNAVYLSGILDVS